MDYVAQNCLRRHNNADIVSGTKLSFPEHAGQSGICSVCSRCASCEIGFKAKTASTIFSQPFGSMVFGAEKRLPNLEDLQIIPELLGNGVDFRKVKTETEIGGFKSRAPLILSAIGSNSLALSMGNDLSLGAALAGIPMVVGENVFASFGLKGLKERIDPFLKNHKKFGAVIVQASLNDLQQKVFEKAAELGAMGLEIKLGQGSQASLGWQSQLSDAKETSHFEKMNYAVLKENCNTHCHALPSNITEIELREKLVKYSELDLPLWVRVPIGAGIVKLIETLQRIKREQDVKLTAVVVDGYGSGTAMAPWLLMNETGLPSAALFGVMDDKPSFDIVLAGGYSNGADVSKALMLGAKAVSMSRAFLIAANALKEGKKNGIDNFTKAIERELQFFCASQRIEIIEELHRKRKNLFALSKEASEMFSVSSNPKTVL